MAEVVITIKIMPESPETNFDGILEQVKKDVAAFGGEVGKVEYHPVAFGLKAMHVIFVMDEEKGSTEELEKKIATISEVNSVDVIDVRRAVG